MPDLFPTTFVGVRDGSIFPPNRADGRLVGAKSSKIVAPKVAGQAIAIGDQLFLGTLAPGESLREVTINTDTSLGTTQVAIGTKAATGKYRAAAVFTAPLDSPTNIGPRANVAGAVLTAAEDIWATFTVAGVAGGVNLVFELEISSIK
jgi:hypothetical protein